MISRLVRKQIRQMKEINWGDVPDNTPYRLLWGENMEVLPECINAMRSELKKINLYPSATKEELREAIAEYCNVQLENIIVTNGSDEGLELIAKVFLTDRDEVIIPSPSYPCFASVSQMMGAKIVKISLEKDFTLDIGRLLDKVSIRTKIIWIANPNNPTGNLLLTEKQIEELAQKTKCIIVIDECYFELTNVSAIRFINRYPQIIITRSFSKIFSLAGARLGYIVASADVTKYLNRLEQTNQVFNTNRFALAAGISLLQDPNTVKNATQSYLQTKNVFTKLLKSISRIEVIPTQTTFCLFRIRSKSVSAYELKQGLLKEQIYIKDCSIYEGLDKQYVYLGVPQEKYQKRFITLLRKAFL